MANAFFLVGVGGTGRGVLNHVKYDLEQSCGSPGQACTVLLAIDGPPAPSQYALPGHYEIDCGPGSPEFYRLTNEMNPADVARRIAQEATRDEDKYIVAWLSPQNAAKYSPDFWNPEAGFGGQPVPSHAYFHMDVNNLQTRLNQEYLKARRMRGGSDAQESQPGQQVIVCIVGSHSGGTGSGMLWDIAHLLKKWVTTYKDQLWTIIPWGGAYHKLVHDPKAQMELDAKNYAALLSVQRFMGASDLQPTYLPFGDHENLKFISSQLFALPFFLDGRGNKVDLSQVNPQLGVVPAVADFLVTIIRDNQTTAAVSENFINWASKLSESLPQERYCTLGSYSIRYPYQDVLASFVYKFTYEIFNGILHYQSGMMGKGEILARSVLNDFPFTNMWEDYSRAPLTPENCQVLGDRIKIGRGDSVPPVLENLSERIGLGWGPFRKLDETVIDETNTEMANDQKQADNYIRQQYKKLTAAFEEKVNNTLLDIFYNRQGEKWTPVTLQENPNTIVVARDFLKYLIDKGAGFYQYVEEKYREYYFPEGPTKPDLITKQAAQVDEKKRIMLASPGKDKEEQEDFLGEADILLDFQIWQKYVIGVQQLTRFLQEYLNYLWNLIGDEADGWIKALDSHFQEMHRRYASEISRRQRFSEILLRQYLPEPGGQAEEKLFENLVDPEINNLLSKMYWTLAIEANPQAGEERVTIVLNSPRVEGFHYPPAKRFVIDKATGEKVAVGIYSPHQHVAYAHKVLGPLLQNVSLWQIMEYGFRFDWLEDQGKNFQNLSMAEARDERRAYVRKQVDTLVTRNSSLLELTQGAQTFDGFFISNFQRLPDDDQLDGQPPEFRDQGGEIAHLLVQELEKRITNLKIKSHPNLKHELRAATSYLLFNLKNWKYFYTAQSRYLEYHQDPRYPLLNIYLPEQHAWHVRGLIRERLDHTFDEILDPQVTALLDDLTVFTRLSLCYAKGIIPTRRSGLELTDPDEYYLPYQTGDISLAPVEDLDRLYRIVCRRAYVTSDGRYHTNDLICSKVIELWRQEETTHITDVSTFLEQLETRLKELQLPPGTIPRKHLELAIKAVVLDYIHRVRAAQAKKIS